MGAADRPEMNGARFVWSNATVKVPGLWVPTNRARERQDHLGGSRIPQIHHADDRHSDKPAGQGTPDEFSAPTGSWPGRSSFASPTARCRSGIARRFPSSTGVTNDEPPHESMLLEGS